MTASQVHSSYPPLDHSSRQIRLLSVREDADGKIACNLSVFDLLNCPPFIALSYVWGSPDIQHEIKLDGHAFSIRHNLYLGLRAISNHIKQKDEEQNTAKILPGGVSSRLNAAQLKQFEQSPTSWKYFWIDAICINQNQVSERNHQVRMMSGIYKSAAFVLVWLGLSCEKALRLIATAEPAKLREVYEPYTDRFRYSEFSAPLVPLLESDYWTRMWIVQELVLARDLVFASGSALVRWDRVSHVFPDIYSYRGLEKSNSALTLINERRHHIFRQKQGIRPDVHELVRRFGLMDCSDPRDRVFALSGLLGEGSAQDSNVLIVDYSLSPVQLSVRILRLASRSIRHLGPLKEFHVWLDAALEVNPYNFDYAANKERRLILKGAYNADEDVSLEPSCPFQPIWTALMILIKFLITILTKILTRILPTKVSKNFYQTFAFMGCSLSTLGFRAKQSLQIASGLLYDASAETIVILYYCTTVRAMYYFS